MHVSHVEKSTLDKVAQRVVARYLTGLGRSDVHVGSAFESLGGRGIDVTYPWRGRQHGIKVKSDPYFGTDAGKIADRALPYYRADTAHYAFEAVANSATREPGWVFDSAADDLYYYLLAIGQPEDEVKALLAEDDSVLFSELRLERDSLTIMPMSALRAWFEANFEHYTPRPVVVSGVSAWYRLVPRPDIETAVEGINKVGPVFAGLTR